jgi:hypothetical protein
MCLLGFNLELLSWEGGSAALGMEQAALAVSFALGLDAD